MTRKNIVVVMLLASSCAGVSLFVSSQALAYPPIVIPPPRILTCVQDCNDPNKVDPSFIEHYSGGGQGSGVIAHWATLNDCMMSVEATCRAMNKQYPQGGVFGPFCQIEVDVCPVATPGAS